MAVNVIYSEIMGLMILWDPKFQFRNSTRYDFALHQIFSNAIFLKVPQCRTVIFVWLVRELSEL